MSRSKDRAAAEAKAKEEAAAAIKSATLRPVAAKVVRTNKGTVLVANHHTGGITFPRKSDVGVLMPPLRLPPGTTTRVDAAEWQMRKKMKVVQHYLDAGLIAEVKVDRGDVPVTSTSSTKLDPPDILKTDKELMEGNAQSGVQAKAKVVRQNPGAVDIK